MSLLEVKNLSVSFTQGGKTTEAVKNVSFTVAYVDAGSIANEDDQQGLYASLQVSF